MSDVEHDRLLGSMLLLGVVTGALQAQDEAIREVMAYKGVAPVLDDMGTVTSLRIAMGSGSYLLTIAPEYP